MEWDGMGWDLIWFHLIFGGAKSRSLTPVVQLIGIDGLAHKFVICNGSTAIFPVQSAECRVVSRSQIFISKGVADLIAFI